MQRRMSARADRNLGLRRAHMQWGIMKAKYMVTVVMQNCLLNSESDLKTNGTANSRFQLVAVSSAVSCDES